MKQRTIKWLWIIAIFIGVSVFAFCILLVWAFVSVMGPPKFIGEYVMPAGESELVIPYSQYSHPFLVLEAELPGTDEERAAAWYADSREWFHLVARNEGEIVSSETLRVARTHGPQPPNLGYRIDLPPYHDMRAGDVDELRISLTDDAPSTLPRPIRMRLYYMH